MLKSAISQSYRSFQRKPTSTGSVRRDKSLSTNSAIQRGLRKSSSARGAFRNNIRDDGHRRQGPPGNGFSKEFRTPKPDHLHKQDSEIPRNSAIQRGIPRPSFARGFRSNSRDDSHALRRSPDNGFRKEPRNSRPNHLYKQGVEAWTNLGTQRGPGSSGSAREGFRSNSRDNSHRKEEPQHNGFQKEPRIRRPNHLHKQDVEDMVESQRLKQERITPKRRRYLAGGRKQLNHGREQSETEDYKPRERLPTRVFKGGKASTSREQKVHFLSEPTRGEYQPEAYGSSRSRVSRLDAAKPVPDVPLTVPYTTPASEFLYGTSVVSAALRFSQRTLYKLYCHNGPARTNSGQDIGILHLARSKGVEIRRVGEEWSRILDKMSTGRPHNGYILEASPLPRFPVVSLQSVGESRDAFYANLDHQSREEEAINGTDGMIRYTSNDTRYPVVLLLDNIVDPGNLGAILRTAYVFGVDAIAISSRNCAPLGPVTLKASAGASESIRLLSIQYPDKFVEQSQRNGWRLFAAVAPSESSRSGRYGQSYVSTSSLKGPARDSPCILMLGGEGEGLRPGLRKRANNAIGIEGQRLGQGGVDSLNVSVAAGILCEAFMKQPADKTSQKFEDPHTVSSDEGSQTGLHSQSASINKAQEIRENTDMLF